MGELIDVSPDVLDEHAQAVTNFMAEPSGATSNASDLLDLRAFGIALITEAQSLQIWIGAADQFIGTAIGAGHQVAGALTSMADAYRGQEGVNAESFEHLQASLDGDNPLVAKAPSDWNMLANFTTEANADLAGSGIFYDIAQTLGDSGGSLAIDVAADGLDLLGFVSDPFGVLLGSAIGWIIEHIGFLKDALDIITGDPDEVRAKAQTWQNVAAALVKSGTDYQQSAGALKSQQAGTAIDAYCRAAVNYVRAVGAGSSHADDAAKAFEVAGAMVGTVRGLVRDNIAQFAADELIEGLIALAASPQTFGGSIAAWVLATVGQATSLAARDAAKITRRVSEIEDFLGAAKRSTRSLEDGAREFDEGAKAAENAERGAKEAAEDRASRQLHDADTEAQREAARKAMWNAEARQREHLDKAAHAREDVDRAHERAGETRERYRDSYRVLPEMPRGPDLASRGAKEGALQGKESAHRHGEGGEEAEQAGDEVDDEVDDGSLVSSESG